MTFCPWILLLSSDHIFFIIEKILSTGADVSSKQNTIQPVSESLEWEYLYP